MDALETLDWSLIRSFLAVAQTGSLSEAARQLGSSQPTVGRQIRSLEATLSAELFHRHAKGLELTEFGRELIPAAQSMHDAANSISLQAAGTGGNLAGVVRLTASVFMAQYVLPRIIAEIRRAAPEIQIELVASDSSDNLLFREADIAVRMYRPTQLDMIALHLGDISLGLYASKTYAAQNGLPTTSEELGDHAMVGYDRNDQIIRAMRAGGLPATPDWFAVRCDNQSTYWALVTEGCGIGFCQRHVATNTPDMIEVLPGLDIPEMPVWLTTHQAMRHSPRIARIWELLGTGLKQVVS